MENWEDKYLEKWSCVYQKLDGFVEIFQFQIVFSIITNEIWPVKDYYDNIIVENLIRRTEIMCKLVWYRNIEYICMKKNTITIKYINNSYLKNLESIKSQLKTFKWTLDEKNNTINLQINYNNWKNYAYI